MATPLATVADLGAYLGEEFAPNDPGALICLRIASGYISDYLQMEIVQTLGDVVYLDPLNSGIVLLPEIPVTNVSLVEIFDGTVWNIADPSTFTLSRRTGVITPGGYCGVLWPLGPETWRVTYDHGYLVIPDGIVAVCLGVAAHIFATEDGIDSERIGGYQVKYSADNDGFTALQLKSLNRRAFPRIG